MLPGMSLSSGTGSTQVAPSIAASATSQGATSNSTSHTINYPSGISSGELLVGFFGLSAALGLTLPAGWSTPLGVTGTGGFLGRLAYSVKIATGSEGSTFTATLGSSGGMCSIVYRVTGNRPGIVVNTDQESWVDTMGSSTNPDPGSFNISWGQSTNLIITSLIWQDRSTTRTGTPSGYSLNSAATTSSSGANAIALAAVGARKEAASEDVGAWTLSTAEQTAMLTLVLRAP